MFDFQDVDNVKDRWSDENLRPKKVVTGNHNTFTLEVISSAQKPPLASPLDLGNRSHVLL